MKEKYALTKSVVERIIKYREESDRNFNQLLLNYLEYYNIILIFPKSVYQLKRRIDELD